MLQMYAHVLILLLIQLQTAITFEIPKTVQGFLRLFVDKGLHISAE